MKEETGSIMMLETGSMIVEIGSIGVVRVIG